MDKNDGAASLVRSDALLDAVADLLECFAVCEGTWYQREWRAFGISEDMERVLCDAWERKHGKASNDELSRLSGLTAC
jgi:hypothetical protein